MVRDLTRQLLLAGAALVCMSCGAARPTAPKACTRTERLRETTVPPKGLLARIQERTHVVLLGTGTPNADPARQGPRWRSW